MIRTFAAFLLTCAGAVFPQGTGTRSFESRRAVCHGGDGTGGYDALGGAPAITAALDQF